MSFATEQIDLSMCSAETGRFLAANLYTLEGVKNEDGSPRVMSMSELVLAICLQRASGLENGYVDSVSGKRKKGIIDLMEDIAANSAMLKGLTEVEEKLVEIGIGGSFDAHGAFTYDGMATTYYNFLFYTAGVTGLPAAGTWSYDNVQTAISLVEDKMDSLNTLSQDLLIELQSLTAKRDQTYDLASNAIKSFNTVLLGTVNNM